MFFNSMSYLVFLPFVIIVYYVLPKKIRHIWLLVASYFFYMNWKPEYALLILAVTVVSYAAARIIDGNSVIISSYISKKGVMISAVLICIAMLFYYKYFNFIILTINSIFQKTSINYRIQTLDIILPVGISFYVFQAIGYVIDVYNGKVNYEKNFLKYALFISFFPQLVAGPIERAGHLINQLNNPCKLDANRLKSGLVLILIGIWQKVLIADNISVIVGPIYSDYANYPGVYAVVATILFAFQVYCDFAGYTNIAIGSAKLFGIDLMNNFQAPFCARNISEFWKRWHISLTGWLREYVYYPLGGNRVGRTRKLFNSMIVFLVSGLWHGASWNYVAWGGINGIMVFVSGMRPKDNYSSKVDALIDSVKTFTLFCFTLVFFRARSFTEALRIFRHVLLNFKMDMFNDSDLLNNIFGSVQMVIILFISIFILLCLDMIQYRTGDFVRYILYQKELYRWVFYIFIIIMIVIYGAYGDGYEQTKFIYFQF